uniref:Uncharacterized protein n=1 Tax=Magallana gigas TaxID=29159 RepID=K1R1L2_MAGGI
MTTNNIPEEFMDTVEEFEEEGFLCKIVIFYQLFDPQDYQSIFETFLQNNMTPQTKLQEISLLVYKM